MKKILIMMMLVPSLCMASFDVNVRFGDRGPDVLALQQFLKYEGFFTADPTGNFFGITKQAVKDFQSANYIISTGYFGPLSRAVANQISEDIATINQSSGGQGAPTDVQASQIVTDVSPEKQIVKEEPIQMTLAPIAPNNQDECLADGNVAWDETGYSDPKAKWFVWFGQSKELSAFTVERLSTTTVKVNVVGNVRNDNGLDMQYQVFYSLADVGRQLEDTSSVTSTSMPVSIDLSEEYLGHKVAFQLLVSYKCLKQYTGWDYMKASSASFQYLNM